MLTPERTCTSLVCRACGSAGGFSHFVTYEMMFGTRDEFEYAECETCGSIQIVDIPADLAKYYPSEYYSFSTACGKGRPPYIRKLVTKWALSLPRFSPVDRILARRYPFIAWARTAGARQNSAVLDLGCGSGRLLRRMQRCGFSNLTGADPYAPADVEEPGFRIRAAELSSIRGRFDFIIISHALEHVLDPLAELSLARDLLNPDGVILVRIPVAGSRLQKEFGPDWFNLDPPRHLFVPSQKGMHLIAEAAGLRVKATEFDSMEDSFLMSESYSRGIPMIHVAKPCRKVRNRLRRRADALNRTGEADLAAYFLTKR